MLCCYSEPEPGPELWLLTQFPPSFYVQPLATFISYVPIYLLIPSHTHCTHPRAAHNYDGDMLTDEVAQVHRSPGFITSSLLGKTDDDIVIKEFEASHGTVSDLWHAHNRGEETSMNPLGMVSKSELKYNKLYYTVRN